MDDDAVAVQSFLKDLKRKKGKKPSTSALPSHSKRDVTVKGSNVAIQSKRNRHDGSTSTQKRRRSSSADDGTTTTNTTTSTKPVPNDMSRATKSQHALKQPQSNSPMPLPLKVAKAPRSKIMDFRNNDEMANDDGTAHGSLPTQCSYILAPMVGASELPFRLLCRMYGAQACYTPMMDSTRFADQDSNLSFPTSATTNTDNDNDNDDKSDATNTVNAARAYRRQFHLDDQVYAFDHPLVCHVSANTNEQFVQAALQAARCRCDQVDLNLGCPQRTAYLGHYGSYLLDEPDRICSVAEAAVQALQQAHTDNPVQYPTLLPVSVKIRLLQTVDETCRLCERLCAVGVSRIAIHARHRASWERTSAGARDGPALLDQVATIVQQLQPTYPHVSIITNGNTITYDDVVDNLQLTRAHGIMSAEGILDNPALYLPRHGSRDNAQRDKPITIWALRPVANASSSSMAAAAATATSTTDDEKAVKKLKRKLNEIEQLESKLEQASKGKKKANSKAVLTDKESKLLESKDRRQRKLQKLLLQQSSGDSANAASTIPTAFPGMSMQQVTVTLGSLYDAADDKWTLAMQYVDLATAFPVAIRTVVFHVRRMLKDMLIQYQVLEECLQCSTIDEVRAVLVKIDSYRHNPSSFVYDSARAKAEADALARKKHEEGKRKAYEARMMRKAKREGRADLNYYLHQGAALPTLEQMRHYRSMDRNDVMTAWKQHHSQHCLSFHLDKCTRDRACAFLHVELANATESSFRESDKIAG